MKEALCWTFHIESPQRRWGKAQMRKGKANCGQVKGMASGVERAGCAQEFFGHEGHENILKFRHTCQTLKSQEFMSLFWGTGVHGLTLGSTVKASSIKVGKWTGGNKHLY